MMEFFPLQKKETFILAQTSHWFSHICKCTGNVWILAKWMRLFFQLKPIELGDTVSAWLNILLNHVMSQRKSIECKTQNLNRRTNALHSLILLLAISLVVWLSTPFAKGLLNSNYYVKLKKTKIEFNSWCSFDFGSEFSVKVVFNLFQVGFSTFFMLVLVRDSSSSLKLQRQMDLR